MFEPLSLLLGADVIGVTDCDTFYPFFASYNMMSWLATTLDMSLHSSSVQNTGCVTAHLYLVFTSIRCVHRLGVISRFHITNSSHQVLHTKEGMCDFIFQY